jgi:riboflavin-specific deaminase-like protein
MIQNNKFELAINMAMTLDGKVTRPDGKWYGLSSRKDKERMDVYRAWADALIVGKNSILNDNPVVHLRYVNANSPRIVLLVRKGSLPKNRRVFQLEKKPLLFCTNQNYTQVCLELSEVAEIHCLGEEIEPNSVIQSLVGQNYKKILLEGGPTLNYIFFQQNLVTKLHLTIVPFIIGQSNLKSIVEGKEALFEFDKSKWKLENVEKIENELFLTYVKKDNL